MLNRWFAASAPRFLSACNLAVGPLGCGLAALDDGGRILWRSATTARGHTVEPAPGGALCALIDRKPGAAITLLRTADGAPLRRIAAAGGYSFDGHAVFSGDGARLYATESRDGDQAGRIAVIRVADGVHLSEYASGGIEPHELIWLQRDRVLAVANGGIRDKQAMEVEIDSSLVLLDAADGTVLSATRLGEELASLSIRHLALGAAGEIVFAMQDQDAGTEWRPMVGLLRPDGVAELLEMPVEQLMRLRGYCGSAAVDRGGTIAAATSPHGGVAAFWHLPTRRFLGLAELRDCCGIAAADTPGAFLLTSGDGTRMQVDAGMAGVTARVQERPANGLPQWDNHLTTACD